MLTYRRRRTRIPNAADARVHSVEPPAVASSAGSHASHRNASRPTTSAVARYVNPRATPKAVFVTRPVCGPGGMPCMRAACGEARDMWPTPKLELPETT